MPFSNSAANKINMKVLYQKTTANALDDKYKIGVNLVNVMYSNYTAVAQNVRL